MTVTQTLTTISVSPSTVTIPVGTYQQFAAVGYDQFGIVLPSQPSFTWSVTSGGIGGTVSASGLYLSPSTAYGVDHVQASSGAASSSTTINVSQPYGGWQGYAGGAQHTAAAPATSQALQSVHWSSSVDLAPQYSGNDLLIHYGSPVITPSNTVLIPVKTGATDGFEVMAKKGSDGTLLWTQVSDYSLPAHKWTPSFSPTLTPSNRLYFPAAGGTVQYIDNPDSPGATITGRFAFYGLANYQANTSGYNSNVKISTPITSDASGNIYFGYTSTGAVGGIVSGVAKITPAGVGTWVAASSLASGSGFTISQVAMNAAPAVSNDGTHLYVVVNSAASAGTQRGKIVELNTSNLTVAATAALLDPSSGQNGIVTDDSTASPTVGLDGDVYIGVLESPFPNNHDRGWLLHFSGDLSQSKTAGSFGWDDPVSIVPKSMIPSYSTSSPYLIMTKYNDYGGVGGTGINKIAVLDPDVAASGGSYMNEVRTIAGVTPDPDFPSLPGAVREWCINSAVVDPATNCILANSEDGKLYRWDLTTNTFTLSIVLTPGVGEAYTPTVVGPDGTVYAINNATLYAVGASTVFVTQDATTSGNWMKAYGADGYDFAAGPVSLPNYATVSVTNAQTFIWDANGTDVFDLQKPNAPANSRLASTWFSGAPYSIHIGINDATSHRVALYFLNWTGGSQSERVDVTSDATNALIDSHVVTNYAGGVYLVYNFNSNVTITINPLGGALGLASGMFFGAAPASPNSAAFLA